VSGAERSALAAKRMTQMARVLVAQEPRAVLYLGFSVLATTTSRFLRLRAWFLDGQKIRARYIEEELRS
jgi:hypothetical protein